MTHKEFEWILSNPIEPVGYLEMLMLIRGAEKVLTDSGEWMEYYCRGGSRKIATCLETNTSGPRGDFFGDGHAGIKVINSLDPLSIS